jgi:hypothetical protein
VGEGFTMPSLEYPNAEEDCAIVGGYVYRGDAQRSLLGRYIFGDYCSGKIWTAPVVDPTNYQLGIDSDLMISSFAEMENGDVYVIDARGSIFLLAAD